MNLNNFDFSFFLNQSFAGNLVQDYLIALIVFVLIYSVLKIIVFVFLNKLKKLTKLTSTDLDELIVDMLLQIHWPFFIIVSLFVSIQFLFLPALISNIIYYLFLLGLLFYSVKGLQQLIDFFVKKKFIEKKERKSTQIKLISDLFKWSLWLFAFLLFLQNVGIEVTALIAGLGVGGLAIAFALQTVLSDIFASFSIYFDKPFKEGDFIIIGNDAGTVEKIGLKSTRVKTLQGQELVVSNQELTSIRVNNYKKMNKRRIEFKFGVEYGTSLKKLEKIPEITKKIINSIELAKADRVHFKEFGDFSLIFVVVYFIDSNDFTVYMDIQQKINFGLKKVFEKEKIEFAFPTQKILLEK